MHRTSECYSMLKGLLIAVWLCAAPVGTAIAQDAERFFIQIEALATLVEAEERARAYSSAFPNVAGFQLRSGWYAIMLGPYSEASAPARLSALISERLIPSDSYLNDGGTFRSQFWPAGAGLLPQAPLAGPLPEAEAEPEPNPEPEPVPEIVTEPAMLTEPDETRAEARETEIILERPTRESLQTALQWFGFYTSTIDGDFGPGTRDSMARWQEANGYEVTGVLTTRQRGVLLAAYNDALTELGLEQISEAEAGIEIILPMAMVTFDDYEPPFVHFKEKAGSGVRVILISQPGDQATLYGLYDLLQSLEVVPTVGERERRERSFTINATSSRVQSHTYAELSNGMVKGYMLVWTRKDAEKMERVLAVMQSSFKPVGARALDPGLVPMPDAQRQGLLSGLEVRRPEFSRTGFFVDADGAVLTVTEATSGCARITLDLTTEADVVLTDAASGVALLRPKSPLSPRVVAGLATGPGRLGDEVAVSGYSYGDQLPSPTLTFGTIEDFKGLDGQTHLNRLTIDALAGDAGGPVVDSAGAVLGMLLPRDPKASRQLPQKVHYAASAATLAAVLSRAKVTPPAPTARATLAPDELDRVADGMTVLVSCWK